MRRVWRSRTSKRIQQLEEEYMITHVVKEVGVCRNSLGDRDGYVLNGPIS